MDLKYSKEELSIISHALGVALFKSVISNKKKDKELPAFFYRNYYQEEENAVFEALIQKGFAAKNRNKNLNYYFVTDLGVEKFKKEFLEIVNYKPVKERDLDYLKHRINWYCDFYNYKFGNDNYNHVVFAYVNYYLEGYYMSSTTTDCVMRFKSELNFCKKELVEQYKKN